MIIRQSLLRVSLGWGELYELFDRVHLDVLVDRGELAAFLDLALKVAFLVEEVLETKVGLVHVMSGIGCDLFMGASGGIGFAVEGL
jgi:hypothetical protein